MWDFTDFTNTLMWGYFMRIQTPTQHSVGTAASAALVPDAAAKFPASAGRPFSMAMLNNQRVTQRVHPFICKYVP